MNEDMLAGEGRDVVGKVKETAGKVTGDRSLQGEGLADQLNGKVQKLIGAAKDAVAGDGEPLLGKARRFTRKRLSRRPRWLASSVSHCSTRCAASADPGGTE